MGHDDTIMSVAFSRNSQRLISAADGFITKIWDPLSGQCIQTLEECMSNTLAAVALSHDSRCLAQAVSGCLIKLWDLVTGDHIRTLESKTNSICSFAFSHDDRRLAAGSYDYEIKIWDLATGECLHTLEGHTKAPAALAFSHDDTRLASGSEDQTIRIWDSASGECLQALGDMKRDVYLLAFSPDGLLLAATSWWDDIIKIWELSSATCFQTLESEINERVEYLSFDPTGSFLDVGLGWIKVQRLTPGQPVNAEIRSKEWDDSAGAPGHIDKRYGYGVSKDKHWITCGDRNVLWLPSEYRPTHYTVRGMTVAIGCALGQVFVLSFSRHV
jgi:WD40 repeat protein